MAEDVYTRPGPTNDTYQSLSHPNPGTRVPGTTRPNPRTRVPGTPRTRVPGTPGTRVPGTRVPRNTAQRRDSGEPKKNVYRAAAVCLGLTCLLLSAGIIGLVVHNNNLVEHLDQTEQKAMFETRWDQLYTRYTNATEQNANLLTRYTNLTEERDDLKKRLCACEKPGWQTFGGSYYYISTERKTWEESRQWCRDRQSDLMVITSPKKQDFVFRLGQRVWLGLTDRERERTFNWVDGTPLTKPTFWNYGEPNNNGQAPNKEEDCVEFILFSQSGGWNDISCTHLNQWICESVTVGCSHTLPI